MKMPALQEMNCLTSSQQNLLLVRLLMASDGLTTLATSLERTTVGEILDVADAVLQIDDVSDKDDVSGLTIEEKSEYIALIETLREYAEFQDA